jgi:serine phosphatase RsbU (regulator of sigma subunit)
MIYGEIASDGKFRFISAGHGPPSVFSREYGHFVKISPDRLVSFTPVGMLPSSDDPDDRVNPPGFDRYMKHYEVNEIDLLAKGDILLLHTDGLTEHAEGDYYPDRLEQLLANAGDASAEDLCAKIREDLLSAAEPEDDISFVVIRKTG